MDDFDDADAARQLMALLDGVSNAEFRTIGLEALRRALHHQLKHQPHERDALKRYSAHVIDFHGPFGIEVVKLLADRKGLPTPDTHSLKEPFVADAAMFREWMAPVAEFIWWLERAGLAVQYVFGDKSPDPRRYHARVFPMSIRLTARGVRLLEGSDDDPLLPGFLDRIKQRCPDLPDGVIALLVDARECLDRMLLRPATILIGVAYELAIEEAIDPLVTKGLIKSNTLDQKASIRLERIREVLRDDAKMKLLQIERDDRRRVEAAYDFADLLRLTRNDAAHTRPAYDYEHGGETEELLVSVGRHLPGIWLLVTRAKSS